MELAGVTGVVVFYLGALVLAAVFLGATTALRMRRTLGSPGGTLAQAVRGAKAPLWGIGIAGALLAFWGWLPASPQGAWNLVLVDVYFLFAVVLLAMGIGLVRVRGRGATAPMRLVATPPTG